MEVGLRLKQMLEFQTAKKSKKVKKVLTLNIDHPVSTLWEIQSHGLRFHIY